jgi:hypothetical protein
MHTTHFNCKFQNIIFDWHGYQLIFCFNFLVPIEELISKALALDWNLVGYEKDNYYCYVG